MNWLRALKAKLRWSAWGGQHTVIGGLSDWQLWHGQFPGTGFDYAAAAGNLWQNPVVMACVSWMQRAFPEATLQVVRREAETGEENPVPGHPLTQLLCRPNRFHSGDLLWQAVLHDWVLTGNAYLVKFRNAGGQVTELWHVPQHRLRPQWEPTGREFIGHYIYLVDGRWDRLPVEDVIHFRFGKDPVNERLGWSPVLAGLREIVALNEGAAYRGAILRNMGVPSHLVSPKGDKVEFTPEQARELLALWQQRCGGDQRGRPIVPNMPTEATKIGYSPQELDLGTMLNWDADMVCSLIGLSSMVVGISAGTQHRTYANMAEAREMAFENNVVPTQKLIGGDLNVQLLADLGDPKTERVTWDYSQVRILQEDENQLWQRVINAKEKQIITVNEARVKLGLPEIDGHDTLCAPAPPPAPDEPGEDEAEAEAAAPVPNRNERERELEEAS